MSSLPFFWSGAELASTPVTIFPKTALLLLALASNGFYFRYVHRMQTFLCCFIFAVRNDLILMPLACQSDHLHSLVDPF